MTPAATRSPLRRYRYPILLALLLAGLVIQSFGTSTFFNAFWHDALQTAVALATFVVAFDGRRERSFAGALLVALIGVGWSRHATPPALEPLLSAVQAVAAAGFFWMAVWAILVRLFSQAAPGSQKIVGAACGYLVAGAAWAPVNALIYQFAPGTFTFDPHVAALLGDWSARTAIWSYYSYTQMLTIGYADITAVRAPATTASLLGALFGLFYTAVVVSQFVSMAQAARDDAARRD
jgi:uncharacterized membrane protein